jgi:hypothetical protein
MTNMMLIARRGPPRWSFCITFGVWMVGLLFWFNQLDEGFAYDLARGLLHVLETGKVELLHFGFFADSYLVSLLHWYRNRSVVIIEGSRIECTASSLSFPVGQVNVVRLF